MRRAFSLLSRLPKPKPFSQNTPRSLLSEPRPFPKCPPCRPFQTFSQNAPAPASRERTIKDAEEALESATTAAGVLSAFRALEASLDDRDPRLGLACLKVGQHLDSADAADPAESLRFALRALDILNRAAAPSISTAMALHLAGSASYDLKRFSDSLGFLNRANRILAALEHESGESAGFDARPVSHAVHLQLANTKTALGRREEALVDLRKCLELKESILEPGSKELGGGYRDLAEAYAAALNFREALPLCLKALEVHEARLGQNSVEVAHDRRLLGVIYTGLEEHEKALEQNELSQKVLKSWGMGSDLLHAEIDAANIQIALGKYDEAVTTLKRVAQQTDEESDARVLVFISMAKALCSQEKRADARRCLEIACGVLKPKELDSPSMVAEAYAEISALYELMNEFGTAISLLKRSLSMLEKLPQEQHVEGNISARIGWLLLLTGKVELAIPYLESAAERMKESFGPKHFAVGYIYNNLGAAYLELDRLQSAAQMFALAMDVMDVSLGPHHADSIEACQSLANAYSAMGSYALAMEFQQRVIDAWASHGPSAKDELKEAMRLLEELKKKAFGSLSDAAPEEAMLLPCENKTGQTKHMQQ